VVEKILHERQVPVSCCHDQGTAVLVLWESEVGDRGRGSDISGVLSVDALLLEEVLDDLWQSQRELRREGPGNGLVSRRDGAE
jgi:hypothetical protein